jgi:hypothetical protein
MDLASFSGKRKNFAKEDAMPEQLYVIRNRPIPIFDNIIYLYYTKQVKVSLIGKYILYLRGAKYMDIQKYSRLIYVDCTHEECEDLEYLVYVVCINPMLRNENVMYAILNGDDIMVAYIENKYLICLIVKDLWLDGDSGMNFDHYNRYLQALEVSHSREISLDTRVHTRELIPILRLDMENIIENAIKELKKARDNKLLEVISMNILKYGHKAMYLKIT